MVINDVNIFANHGWFKIWIESDSMYVVMIFHSRDRDVPLILRTTWERVVFSIMTNK